MVLSLHTSMCYVLVRNSLKNTNTTDIFIRARQLTSTNRSNYFNASLKARYADLPATLVSQIIVQGRLFICPKLIASPFILSCQILYHFQNQRTNKAIMMPATASQSHQYTDMAKNIFLKLIFTASNDMAM